MKRDKGLAGQMAEQMYIPKNAAKGMLAKELAKLDVRRNVIHDLANLFWVPKSLISFQMQEMVRSA